MEENIKILLLILFCLTYFRIQVQEQTSFIISGESPELPSDMVACMRLFLPRSTILLFTASQKVLKHVSVVAFKLNTLRNVIFIYFSKCLVGNLQKTTWKYRTFYSPYHLEKYLSGNTEYES